MEWLLNDGHPFLYIEGFDGRVGMIVPPDFDFQGMGYHRVTNIVGRVMRMEPGRLNRAISIADIPNHYPLGAKYRGQPLIKRGNTAHLAYYDSEMFGEWISPLPNGVIDVPLLGFDVEEGIGFQDAVDALCEFPPVLICVGKVTRFSSKQRA